MTSLPAIKRDSVSSVSMVPPTIPWCFYGGFCCVTLTASAYNFTILTESSTVGVGNHGRYHACLRHGIVTRFELSKVSWIGATIDERLLRMYNKMKEIQNPYHLLQ
ncbi:hypothetical protein TNCV_4270051 [Trichonephila clavipes]|nr:hypothetical protein TNCV_4270051 [Trichonephila clavipes]